MSGKENPKGERTAEDLQTRINIQGIGVTIVFHGRDHATTGHLLGLAEHLKKIAAEVVIGRAEPLPPIEEEPEEKKEDGAPKSRLKPVVSNGKE